MLHKMVLLSAISVLTLVFTFVFKTSPVPTHPPELLQLTSSGISEFASITADGGREFDSNWEGDGNKPRGKEIVFSTPSINIPPAETTNNKHDIDGLKLSEFISSTKESEMFLDRTHKIDDVDVENTNVIQMKARDADIISSSEDDSVIELKQLGPYIPSSSNGSTNSSSSNKGVTTFDKNNNKNNSQELNTSFTTLNNTTFIKQQSIDFIEEKKISSSRPIIRTSTSGDRRFNRPPKPSRNASYRNTSEVPVRRLPQAIIIGVKKSGTRALLEFLRIHPDVEGSGPEPHFFDRNYNRGLDWYRSLMPKTYEGQITIEKTPSYFVTQEAPARMFQMNPDVKLILVVRDPVTRAISDYCQAVSKRGSNPMPSFEKMAMADEQRGVVNTNWAAIRIGLYYKHVGKWLETFPRQQIHLVDMHKLITEPAKELAEVERFLHLSPYITPGHFYLNRFKGSFPCVIRKGGKAHCLDGRSKGREHPSVRKYVLNRLRRFYAPFNDKFYEMVGRNFEWPAK